MAEYDLAIIGGGIIGAGIARDAAGRGLRVLLVEQSDLASGTSSASTKLIHGDVNALERHAFRSVRQALWERDVLLRIAPHVVQAMRFVLPPQGRERPAWLVRAELLAYDHLARRGRLPATRTLDLTHHVCGAPLRRRYTFGFEFSDCRVDDSRLVILNAIDAAARGAVIRTRTRCIRADRADSWTLVLNARGRRAVVTARAVVNAAGAWVAAVNDTVLHQRGRLPVHFVKGSHILVRCLFDHDRGYVLPSREGPPVFALPFGREFTLVGTTHADFRGDPGSATPSLDEINSLCGAINAYFRENITSGDVVWSFAGIGTRHDDGVARPADVAAEHVLLLDAENGKAPLLTVLGGRITTYRRVAEDALGTLAHFFASRPRWTRDAPLPGGEFGYGRLDHLRADIRSRWPFLHDDHASRLACAYGTRVDLVLQDAKGPDDLGTRFGADLTAAEVRYLMRHEWAETAEDVLWRRSKLGLHIDAEGRERVARFMAAELGSRREG